MSQPFLNLTVGFFNRNKMQESGKIEELTESVKTYVATNIELVKLEATERLALVGAGMISGLLLGVIAVLLIFFASLWTGFYLSHSFGDTYTGFGLVAGFYLLIGVILLSGGKKSLEKNMRNKIIDKILSKT
ncbi:MAG: phage holin family protein [Bacteroidia bacterium]